MVYFVSINSPSGRIWFIWFLLVLGTAPLAIKTITELPRVTCSFLWKQKICWVWISGTFGCFSKIHVRPYCTHVWNKSTLIKNMFMKRPSFLMWNRVKNLPRKPTTVLPKNICIFTFCLCHKDIMTKRKKMHLSYWCIVCIGIEYLSCNIVIFLRLSDENGGLWHYLRPFVRRSSRRLSFGVSVLHITNTHTHTHKHKNIVETHEYIFSKMHTKISFGKCHLLSTHYIKARSNITWHSIRHAIFYCQKEIT